MIQLIYYRIFDKNYDGYIDQDEFRWMTTSDIISKKTIRTVFEVSFVTSLSTESLSSPQNKFHQRCDADGNGKLDYQEFKAMIFRYRARKEEEGRCELKETKKTKKDLKRIANTNTMNNNFAF